MRRVRPEPHALAGAYALDALTGTERVHFERHVARCRQCAGELGELRAATACLAAAAACKPPPGLTERALAAATRTRQLRPATARPWPKRISRRAPAGSGQQSSTSGTAVRLRPARAPRLALTVTATVTAAVVAAAVVSGVATFVAAHRLSERQLSAQQQLSTQQQRSHAIAVVLTAPDATMTSARIATGGTATIVMSHRYHELVFAASGLAALPPSSCYELWLMGPRGDRPTGMLPAPRHGMTGPVTAAGLTTGDHLGLAIEPAGGGQRPGSKVILVVAL